MTDKARELLERSADLLEWQECFSLAEEIRAYLAKPEVKTFVRLSEEEIRTWNIVGHESLLDFVRAIEGALEEKNK